MISAVSSLNFSPLSQSRPAISHGASLPMLQQRDGFFSATSNRAKLGQFLNKKQSQPFVLAYQAENTKGVWELLAPRKNHLSAMVVSQHPPKAKGLRSGISHNALPVSTTLTPSEKRVLDELIPRVGLGSTQMDKGKNPFMTVPVGLKTAQHTKPSLKTVISIAAYSGERLDSVQSQTLQQAFQAAGKSPLKPGWVVQQGRQLTVLKQDDPRQAGYEKKDRPLATLMMRSVAKTASVVLGLPYQNDQLRLPNGASLSTRKQAWVDHSDNRVDLHQVVQVPQVGAWLKLDTPVQTHTLSIQERGKVLDTVEKTLAQWQADRKEPVSAPQGFTPSIFATQA